MTSADNETRNIFVLGLCVLFAWMAVIIFFSSPQLFRDLCKRYCCRCIKTDQRHRSAIKIKMAQERVRSASKSFFTTSLVDQPSTILLQQVLGGSNSPSGTVRPDPIPEESRCTSLQPTLEDSNSQTSSSLSAIECVAQLPPV